MDENTSAAKCRMFLNGMSPRCGLFLAFAFADILAEGLTADQINVLGGFVTCVGDGLAYIASQMEFNGTDTYPKSAVDDSHESE